MAAKTKPAGDQTAGGRAIWTGAIQAGLITFGVKLTPATESHDVKFRQIHGKCGGHIKYQRYCELEGVAVEWADVDKGYSTPDGMIMFTEAELATLPLDSTRTMIVKDLVPGGQIEPIYYESHYTLTPRESYDVQAFTLFMAGLQELGNVAMTKITIRTRESSAVVHVREGRLALTTLRWDDEIRHMTPPTYPEVSKEDLATAVEYLKKMQRPSLDLSAIEDHYKLALAQLIVKRQAAGLIGEHEPEPVAIATPDVMDLMDKLRASVEAELAKRTPPRPDKSEAPKKATVKAGAGKKKK